MRFFCFFIMLICVQGFCSEKTGKFHALILFDAATTELQASYRQDSVIMKKTFTRVARFIKSPLRLKCVSTQFFIVPVSSPYLLKGLSIRYMS